MTDESDTSARVARRRWLSALGASLSLGVAGCLGDSEDSDEDDGPSDDGTVDGDDSSGGPDDSDTGSGPDGGGDGPDDTAGGDDGSGDDAGGGDGSSDDGGEPAQPDVPVTLTDLRAAQVPITVSLGVDDPAPVAVTVTNNGDTTAEISVEFAVLAGQESVDDSPNGSVGQAVPTDDALVTQTLTVTLESGASERLTASGLTDGLDRGSYTVTATAGDQQATLRLNLFADSPVPVTVYTQAATEEYRAESGQVTIVDDGESVATASLDSQPVTVELPLARTTRYTVEVSNLDGGAWPDSRETVTVDSASDPSIEVVAGYEFSEPDSLRFSAYIYDEKGFVGGPEESYMYGSYAPYNAERSTTIQYHLYWIEEPLRGRAPRVTVDGDPPEYGADLAAKANSIGAGPPSHSVAVNLSEYFYRGPQKHWEVSDNATDLYRRSHQLALLSLSYISVNGWSREWVGEDTVHGRPVDVYEVPALDATVYVDPETSYTRRVERTAFGEEYPNSYEVAEFVAHDEHMRIDWEFIKAHSTGDTADADESLSDKSLDAPPWEQHDTSPQEPE